MPRGKSLLPELRLETLTRFMQKYNSPVDTMLTSMFGSKKSESSSIGWHSQRGGRGMTPFVPPGGSSPLTSIFGVAKHTAEAAYWKEKMYFDEEFLNNLAKPGGSTAHQTASDTLARELVGLKNRSVRRKEWMFSKMLFSGSFSYLAEGGTKLSVDYGLPSENTVTLGDDYKWSTGASKDVMGDIIDGKRVIAEANGGKIQYGICNSQVLEYLGRDTAILALLSKSTFGNGDLFSGNRNNIVGVNPNVLANLLDIPSIIVYDEMYEVRSWITGAVTADSTVAIPVEDVTDWEVGGTLRFTNGLTGTYEDEIIASVQVEAGTVTVATAPSSSYQQGRDYVRMNKRFIPDDQFSMFAPTVEGNSIAEYIEAPFGLGRSYGMQSDSKENWDPDGVFIRVQDKGLPVLYNRDAIYTLTVA